MKRAGPTGVVSEMMKASGGFGTRWMIDLINNHVKEGCIPDNWRKSIMVPVYKEKCDPLMCGSYRAINPFKTLCVTARATFMSFSMLYINSRPIFSVHSQDLLDFVVLVSLDTMLWYI